MKLRLYWCLWLIPLFHFIYSFFFITRLSCTHMSFRTIRAQRLFHRRASWNATSSYTIDVLCVLYIFLKQELYVLKYTGFRIHVDHAESKTLLKESWIIWNRIWSDCQTSWIWRKSPREDGIYKYSMFSSWKKITKIFLKIDPSRK